MEHDTIEQSSDIHSSPLNIMHVKRLKQKEKNNDHNLEMNLSKENINNNNKDKDKDREDKMNQGIIIVNNAEQNNTIMKQTINTLEGTIAVNKRNVIRPISPKENMRNSDTHRLLVKTGSFLTNTIMSNSNPIPDNNNANADDCITIQEDENHAEQVTQPRLSQIRTNMAEIVQRNNLYAQPTQCFICDRFIHTSTMLKAETCNHFFCRKCAKLFYEEKIEQGSTILKCPMYKCNSVLSIDCLHSIVSPQHYFGLAGDRNENNKLKSVLNDTIAIQNTRKEKTIEVKTYSQRHVIDINTNETFYMYNQAKDQFCPQCRENSLFSRNGNHFIKCLNCLNSLCKYCLLPYNVSHLDLHNQTHCKVYFRKVNKSFLNNNNTGRFFSLQLALIIASYVMMFIASFKYNHMLFSKVFCINKCPYLLVKIIVNVMAIIGFLCTLPIILITFPYYPILLEALGS